MSVLISPATTRTHPPLHTAGGQHVRPSRMTAPFLHSTMESHSLLNTPHPLANKPSPTSPAPETVLSPLQRVLLSFALLPAAGVWVKGDDGLRVRTITYGHCFPNDSGREFLKLLRSVWRNFLKLPKVGRTLCCSKQIPGL